VPVSRALVARAREARDIVPDALRARGAEVDVVAVYETVVEPLDEETVEAVAAADYITFTSASTVRNFLAAAGGAQAWLARGPARPRVASIGPVTSAELCACGLSPDVQATNHDTDGLIDALIRA
jgi:uroporphyrinogen III methyltransferase/synthase